jgi:hypothetical protein
VADPAYEMRSPTLNVVDEVGWEIVGIGGWFEGAAEAAA